MTDPDRRRLKAQAKREQFLQERAEILGGSDMIHLLGLEPFGCQRRLCYDKSGIEPDFPQETNADMERGTRLEHVAVEEYEKATGNVCRRRTVIRGKAPWEGCHIDREIGRPIDAMSEWGYVVYDGVLEVKIPSAWNYQIIARQPFLPEAYRAQLQWGLAVTGSTWGAIWVWSPDKWKGVFHNYPRDEELIDKLRQMAARFWQEREIWVQRKEFQLDPFRHVERLEPTDRRCLTCPWRRKCQSLGEVPQEVLDDATALSKGPVVQDESITPLVEQYVEVRARLKQAEEEKAAVKEALELAMAERPYVACGAGKVSYTDVAACEYTVKREASKRLAVRASNG